MATTAATQDVAADRREPEARRAAKPRRTPKDNGNVRAIRYFLTKAASNGTPELDEEMPDEHEALVAALKSGRTFVTVEEWRARADKKKGVTVIGKDPVPRQ